VLIALDALNEMNELCTECTEPWSETAETEGWRGVAKGSEELVMVPPYAEAGVGS
jgi:hypothetical protein